MVQTHNGEEKICRDWVWVLGFGFLSKSIIQPTQLGFGLSLAGVWQKKERRKSESQR